MTGSDLRWKHLTPEQTDLVVEHTGLAFWIAERFHLPANLLATREDVQQVALIGLAHAATTWDPEGVKFVTWARMKIENHVRDYLREIDHLPRSARAKAKADYLDTGREAQNMRQPLSIDGLLTAATGTPMVNLVEAAVGTHHDDDQWLDDDQDRAVIRAFITYCQDQPWFKGHLPYIAHRRIADSAALHVIATEIGLTESRVSQLWTHLLQEASRWAANHLTDLLDPTGVPA